jgi:hypothetical protein
VGYRVRILAGRVPTIPDKRRRRLPKTVLREVWDPAEVRFETEEIPGDLLKHEATRKDPRVRAQIYRRAFEGGYSKDGEWAWLRYPPESDAYRDPRTLWLTRMPGKSFERHRRSVLARSTPQPVDSMFDSAHARTASLAARVAGCGRAQLPGKRRPARCPHGRNGHTPAVTQLCAADQRTAYGRPHRGDKADHSWAAGSLNDSNVVANKRETG